LRVTIHEGEESFEVWRVKGRGGRKGGGGGGGGEGREREKELSCKIISRRDSLEMGELCCLEFYVSAVRCRPGPQFRTSWAA